MEYSKRLQTDLKKQVRSNIRLNARTDREIDKFCENYRSWVQEQKRAGEKPITIIAEGDSWYRYVIGKAVIFHLEKQLNIEILNLASPGDEVSDMLSLEQKKRLVRELKRGPARRQKYDFLLFSGGGNDLVGVDRFYKWLHPYKKGMTAKQLINRKTLKAAFELLSFDYEQLIEARTQHSPNTHIIVHGYDFAIPTGRGVCGRGPWLKPGLERRNIPAKLRREVVQEFLKTFDRLLNRLANKHGNMSVVQSQGVLSDKHWANELHPTNTGFKKIANEFAEEIVALSQ